MIGEAGAWPRDNVVRNRFRCRSSACSRSGGSQCLGRRDRDRRSGGGSGQPPHQQAFRSEDDARPASELLADAGQTITPEGLGADEALRIFEDVIAPRRGPKTIR